MKKFRFFLLTVLTGIIVLAAIVFFMLRGQPKITIDYLAEYNKISRPENYDPCQNAAQLYKEAFESFVQMPKRLQQGNLVYAKWVDDFNKTAQNLLQKWLIANEDSFQKFRAASRKPYYWVERYAFDSDLRNIQILELGDLHYICKAIEWNAKVNASKAQYSQAFDDVLAYYRAAFQRCNTPHFILELRDSLCQQQMAMETASLILKKTQIPASVLKSFQQEIKEISNTHNCSLDFTAEKLSLYDILQRTYVYKPDGSGRLSWEGIKKMSGFDISSIGGWYTFKYFFAGPRQREVKSNIDSYYEQVEEAFTMKPWQLNQVKSNCFEKFERLQKDDLFMFVWGKDYRKIFYDCHDTQAQLQALLATIAVLRFHQDKGHLPNELDELVKEGYLRQLPADPYSSKPIIYSAQGEEFKMYSIGNNFKDDGGKGCFLPNWITGSSAGSADLVFWPPTEPLKILINRKQKNRNLSIQETNQPSQKRSE